MAVIFIYKVVLVVEMMILAGLGILSLLNIESALQNIINRELIVRAGGALFDIWAEPPIQPIFKVFVFNVTNHEAWLAGNGSVKLAVQEIGPLVYRETWWKTNVVARSDGQVSYDLVKRFELVPKLSSVSPDTVVIIPNIPFFSGAARMAGQDMLTIWGFQSAMEMFESKMFIQRTVEEVLWGYEEPLVVGATMVLPEDEIKVPGHFGLLAGRNMTSEGEYTIWGGGGPGGLKDLGKVTAWKGQTRFHAWNTKECNTVTGGEGSQFPPGITKESKPSIFVSAMCRPIDLSFVKEKQVQGVQTFMFEPDQQVFNYSAPANQCYCVPPANCTDSGVFYVAPCKFGAPLVVSWPHFLDAPYHAQRISGLKPHADSHRFHILIQPVMGMGLSASVRLQLNLDMMQVDSLPPFDTLPVPRLLLPVIWFDNTIQEPPETLLVLLKDALALPVTLARGAGTLFLGLILIQGVIYLLFTWTDRQTDSIGQ